MGLGVGFGVGCFLVVVIVVVERLWRGEEYGFGCGFYGIHGLRASEP